eukprot:g3307.t1
MRLLAIVACLVVASTAADERRAAAASAAAGPVIHQTLSEDKVITRVDAPITCKDGEHMVCDTKGETRTCMCIKMAKAVCKGGRKYMACGSPTECQPTCKNNEPCGDAINPCVPGCQCPEGTVDTGVACLPQEQCKDRGSGTGRTEPDGWESFHGERNGGTVEYAFEVGSMSVGQAKEWCSSQETCVAFVYGAAGGKVEMLSSLDHGAWSVMVGSQATGAVARNQGTYVKPACSTPMHPSNGNYVVSGGGVGARALFHCNRGWKLVGSSERVCQQGGVWSGETTFCEEDTCAVAPTVEGATVKVDGEVATYTCYRGRSAVTDGVQGAWWSMDADGSIKSVSVKCVDQRWPTRPTCELDCGVPVIGHAVELLQSVQVKLATGERVARPPTTTVGGKARTRCRVGSKRASGDATRTCGADGRWSGAPLVCQDLGCGKPRTIAHGEYATNAEQLLPSDKAIKWAVGRVAQYNCDEGFQMLGPAISTCQANGKWTEVPVCTKIRVCAQTQCHVVRGSNKLMITRAQKDSWHKMGGKQCPEKNTYSTLEGLQCREAWQTKCDAGHPGKRPHTGAVAQSIDTCHFISVKHKTHRLGSHESAAEEYGNRHRCSVQHPCTTEGCCECLCWFDENEKAPELKSLGYAPEITHRGSVPMSQCEGDCDGDHHCKPGFKCHHNHEKDEIPGCSGLAKEGMDYCVRDHDFQYTPATP